MSDIITSYDIKRLPDKIKKIRHNRSEQYKYAQKHFNAILQKYKSAKKVTSDLLKEYKEAENFLNQYERFKSCVSQEALADTINVKRQTIIDWEKGNTYPSIENLIQLCSVFNCNMDYLLGLVETPITEPVSIAHYFSRISSKIIDYGLKNEDYLDCLNFFMLPENCASLFNDVTISAWRKMWTNSAIADINSPLKEDVIKAHDEFSAITSLQEISKSSYKSFLEKKFPRQKLIIKKEQSGNGYRLKSCFQPLIYQNFFNEKEFNYTTFINYLVDNTFEQLSQNYLIEAQKMKLSKVFINLFEKYLEE